MPKFEKPLLAEARADRKEFSVLKEVIDVDQLVTRHELRKRGFDPAEIIIRPTLVSTNTLASAIDRRNIKKSYIIYNPRIIDSWDAEDFYVMLAHETAHMTQPPEELLTSAATMTGEKVAHKDDRWELDAQIWEARQATRFGWDDERYRLFVDRVYGSVIRDTFGPDFDITDAAAIERLDLTNREFLQVIREEAEARPASFATMRRRPGVRVRGHVRRRR